MSKIQINKKTAIIVASIGLLIIAGINGAFTPTPEKARAGEIDPKAVIESQQSSLAEEKKKLETQLKIKDIDNQKLELEKQKLDLENTISKVEVVDAVKIAETKPAEKIIPAPNKTEAEPVKTPTDDFLAKATSLGIHNDLAVAMKQAGDEFKINPRYLLTIVLSENATSPHRAVGDNGCSFGAYQGNACAGRGRWNEVHFGLKFQECMNDYLCSSKWTANRIVNQYCKNIICTSWISQLSKHNGDPAPAWYSAKIEKNGLRAGLTY